MGYLLAIFGAVVSPTAIAQQPATHLPDKACAEADYLLRQGMLTDARREYRDLLRIDKRLPCAPRGIGEVAAQRAQALDSQRRGNEALVTAEEADDEATRQRIREEAARHFDRAVKLDQSLKQPVKKDKTWPGAASDWLQRAATNVFDFLADFGRFLLAIATALGVVAAVGLLGSRLRGARKWARKHTRGLVTPLSKRESLGRRALGWLYGLQFTIQAIESADETQAKTLKAQLQDAFGASDARLGTGVDLMTPSATGSDALAEFADALKDVPQGKFAAALLRLGRKALPRDAFFLSGALLPAGERGAGLTLALATRGGEVRYTTTLWETSYSAEATNKDGCPGAVYRLAVAGAAWAESQVFDHRHDRLRRRALLGTSDWESYAYTMAGVACRDAGLARDARQLFARAASSDVSNITALLNVAVLELGRQTRGLAVERLECVRDLSSAAVSTNGDTDPRTDPKRKGTVRETDRDDVVRDPHWFAAQYNLALAYLLDAEEDRSTLDGALTAASALVAGCERAVRALKRLEHPAQSGAPARLTRSRLQLLRRIQGPSLVLLASILVERSDDVPGRGDVNVRRDRFLLRLEATSRRAAGRPGARAEPQGPCPLTPAYVVEDYLPSKAERNDRTNYNLACYYTRLARKHDRPGDTRAGAYLEKALDRLRAAAETGVLVSHARGDQALAYLRRKHRRGFLDAIGE